MSGDWGLRRGRADHGRGGGGACPAPPKDSESQLQPSSGVVVAFPEPFVASRRSYARCCSSWRWGNLNEKEKKKTHQRRVRAQNWKTAEGFCQILAAPACMVCHGFRKVPVLRNSSASSRSTSSPKSRARQSRQAHIQQPVERDAAYGFPHDGTFLGPWQTTRAEMGSLGRICSARSEQMPQKQPVSQQLSRQLDGWRLSHSGTPSAASDGGTAASQSRVGLLASTYRE